MAGLRRAAYQIQPLSIIRNLLDRPAEGLNRFDGPTEGRAGGQGGCGAWRTERP